MYNDCLICNRIASIKKGKNPYFVKELKSGYVVMGDHQFYNGYTLLLSKEHVSELHKLKNRTQFLEDMALTAEAVYKTFNPNKLNYELLGNTDNHLHWHLFPRYADDPDPKRAVWVVDKTVRKAVSEKPDEPELENLIKQLKTALNQLTK